MEHMKTKATEEAKKTSKKKTSKKVTAPKKTSEKLPEQDATSDGGERCVSEISLCQLGWLVILRPMSWVHYALGVVVLVAVAFTLIVNRMKLGESPVGDDGFDRARFLSDRSDPRKFWAQAAIALYQDDSDPGCWKQEHAVSCLQGWKTAAQPALVRLLQRYIKGECNVGFDKLRIIYLARAGRGAGFLDEATSWGYAFDAMTEIQRHYVSWEQLRVAMDDGRAQWYGGKDKVPQSALELSKSGWNKLTTNFMGQVPFYVAQSALVQTTISHS